MQDPFKNARKTPWKPCRAGMIQKVALSNKDQSLERRRFLQRLAGIGGAAIIVVGASRGFDWFGNKPDQTAGRIGCIQVHKHLTDYIAHRINDANLRGRIAQHLTKCSGCRGSYLTLVKKNGCSSRRSQVPNS